MTVHEQVHPFDFATTVQAAVVELVSGAAPSAKFAVVENAAAAAAGDAVEAEVVAVVEVAAPRGDPDLVLFDSPTAAGASCSYLKLAPGSNHSGVHEITYYVVADDAAEIVEVNAFLLNQSALILDRSFS